MNKKLHLLLLLPLLFFGINNGFAQRVDYSARSGYDIGFGLGGSYQSSDIRNFSGGAGTFTFGHSIYQKPNAVFGLDWRFRFLGGNNTAFDDRINIDSTYSNVNYTHFNYDLELVLTFNRFRERTRIILSGFGGAGITHSITSFDLLDGNSPYDYSTINSDGNDGRATIYNDLQNMSDDRFETNGINNGCISPTLGVYLGYQFTPRFSMGIEHKVNYFLEETNNNIIGANIDGIVASGSRMDKNNYTALLLKWDIEHGNGSGNIPCNPPAVNLSVRESNSSFASHQLEGTVTNIKKESNISIKINGVPDNNFYFDPGTGRLSSSFNLVPGAHTITLAAQNSCGQDAQSIEVYVKEPCSPPSVKLNVIQLRSNTYTHQMNAKINNVKEKYDINVLVDGVQDNSFEFVNGLHEIRDEYKFGSGTHIIEVIVKNECGQDSESTQIIVDAPCDLPIIDFALTELNNSGFSHKLNGSVFNVSNKYDISISIDGRENKTFNYSSSTNAITASYKLTPGTHNITIIAKNDCGEVSESTEIVVGEPCETPIVKFNILESNDENFTNELFGNISNITNKNQITLLVDGKQSFDFAYSLQTDVLKANYKLNPGKHIITVKAKNECGEDTQSTDFIIEEPCTPPEVKIAVKEYNSGSFTHELSGNILNIENKKQITFIVDGKPITNFGFLTSSGKINARFAFEPGKHSVIVTAKNECGENTGSTEVIIEAPCKLPVVEFNITEIINSDNAYLLEGNIQNIKQKEQIVFLIDGKENSQFEFDKRKGTIKTSFKLESGKHIITITAKNDCGFDTESVDIVVEEPCVTPVVEVKISDIQNATYTHQLIGSVKNVNSKNEITILVDGREDMSFQFNASSNKISDNYKLEPGKHTIKVFAKNECGEDSQSVVIEVEEPCKTPVVNFEFTEVENATYTHKLSGTIENVNSKNEITVLIDGKVDNSFIFSTSSNTISDNYKLDSGNHTITITAKNECGEDTETVSINISEPCLPPTVTFNISEIENPAYTHYLNGMVTNINSEDQITVLVDGKEIKNTFLYAPNTPKFSDSYNLKPGKHTITAIVKNDCGEDTHTVIVEVEEPCETPKVEFRVSETKNASFTHQLNGNVQNINSKNEITVLIDGREDSSFQYNTSSNSISDNYNFEPGKHTIKVIVKNDCGEDSQSVTIEIEAPCDVPDVDFKVSEIEHASFTHEMNGVVSNVQNKNEITVLVDGKKDNSFQYVPNTNKLSGKFKLEPGKHTITVTAKNECGQDSESVVIVIEEPCIPPVVKFSMKEINAKSFNYQLDGTITNIDNKDQITIKIDDEINEYFTYNPKSDVLRSQYWLAPGNHIITITAKNECGEDTESIEITVEEPCETPVVKFTATESDLNNFTHEITGTVTNVKNKSEITVTVDGNIDNSFQYVPNTNVISGRFNLIPGKHTITVTAKNECGEDTESVIISMQEPCVPPVVNFTVTELDSPNYTHQLSGSVANIENKNQITITVDNVVDNNFNFETVSYNIANTYKFDPGEHTIVITVKNECGEDTETIKVKVEDPCIPPVVNFSVSEINDNNFTHQISGTVTNVKNKSEIIVLVNDNEDNSFQYIPNTNSIGGKFNFEAGTHTITVKAQNECGDDTETIQVIVEAPCDEPEVSFSVMESTSTPMRYELTGTTLFTNNKSEIAVLLDGQSVNSFQFISSTHTISATLDLTPGSHTIKVMASNKCGTDSQTDQITVDNPCVPPVVNIYLNESSSSSYTHTLGGTVSNIENKNDITVKVDGSTTNSFQFVPSSGQISANFNFNPGTHKVTVSTSNECGNDSDYTEVTVKEPCIAPVVNFSISESNASNITHTFSGTITNMISSNGISVRVDGSVFTNFQYNASSHTITANLNLSAGTHTISITAKNACGNDTHTEQIVIEDDPCGPRFNPGNADWEFCLITPNGTYNRGDLDDNFTYSGSASSLYFKATAGGGDAIVNGQPYSISSGKYYHFSGNLTVSVSTSNPGSMGLWSVCVESSKAPKSGVGNSRPDSPCEDKGGNNDNNGGRIKDKPNQINVGGRNNTRTNTNSTNSSSTRENNNTNTQEINVGGRNNTRTNTNSTRTGSGSDNTNTNSTRNSSTQEIDMSGSSKGRTGSSTPRTGTKRN